MQKSRFHRIAQNFRVENNARPKEGGRAMNQKRKNQDVELETMRDLVVSRLRNLYEAEHEILEALPEIAAAVSSPPLRQAIKAHLERTREQVHRLEQAFEMMGQPPGAALFHAMDRLRQKREQMGKQAERNSRTDADLIEAARQMEHYESTSYRPARSVEKQWGQPRLTELLQQILEEERDSDEKLTEITEAVVNEK